jgi:hypothetical protein
VSATLTSRPSARPDAIASARARQLAEAGLLSASFVPPKAIRDLRLLTRYRRTQIAEASGLAFGVAALVVVAAEVSV